MMAKKLTHIRVYDKEKIKFDELARELSFIQKANIRIPEIVRRITNVPNIKSILIKDAEAKRGIGKKGLFQQMWVIFLLMFVFMIIIIGFWLSSLVLPVLANTVNDVTSVLDSSSPSGEALNNATDTTFGNVNQGFQGLEWFSYSMLIIMFIGFFFCAFFVRTYPFLLIFWIGFVILMAIVSIILTISYQEITAGDSLIATIYKSHETNDFILNNLPIITIAGGLFGGVILFMVIARDPDIEVTI
jgi:Flp pilus assembly protein TadB